MCRRPKAGCRPCGDTLGGEASHRLHRMGYVSVREPSSRWQERRVRGASTQLVLARAGCVPSVPDALLPPGKGTGREDRPSAGGRACENQAQARPPALSVPSTPGPFTPQASHVRPRSPAETRAGVRRVLAAQRQPLARMSPRLTRPLQLPRKLYARPSTEIPLVFLISGTLCGHCFRVSICPAHRDPL